MTTGGEYVMEEGECGFILGDGAEFFCASEGAFGFVDVR
jgi:hypothetical protein